MVFLVEYLDSLMVHSLLASYRKFFNIKKSLNTLGKFFITAMRLIWIQAPVLLFFKKRRMIMENNFNHAGYVSQGTYIINKAQSVNLDPKILYEAVIDLSTEGLLTATCINMAAGILLDKLGLPNYFFKNITKDSLKNILASIAASMKYQEGNVVLQGKIGNIGFDIDQGSQIQRMRIATQETRDVMEKALQPVLTGHRREYYFCPENNYYTYIFRSETVNDYKREDFDKSRFLFSLAGDYAITPKSTRQRYEKFLKNVERSATPLIEVFNLPETGQTRLVFNSDFALPQLPILRKLLSDHDLILKRAYWEPYIAKSSVPSSICSLYVDGELSRKQEAAVLNDMCAYLSFGVSGVTELYEQGKLSFKEMLFTGNAIDFTHMFVFQERENKTDREIMESLASKDHRAAFAGRIYESTKATYTFKLILAAVKENPDLIKFLFDLFDKKFNPAIGNRPSQERIDAQLKKFEKIIAVRFMDFAHGYDIFKFMFKIVSCTLKTNFYKPEKRSYAFRFDNRILDPLVFDKAVFGIFLVNGHYICGTHFRASDIARGGLRMIRVTPSNHSFELDHAVSLNYALGARAQRLKHKDICESGSKGVIVPHAIYGGGAYSRAALFDYTEGIMNLMLTDNSIVDYYGKPEMIFFGPDEGTAPLMDAVSYRARDLGYKYWRTITTGKSFGIPHDTYGLLENNDVFGLLDAGEKATDLQINGKSIIITKNMDEIYNIIGGKIEISGMTTTSVMNSFRTMITHYKVKEEDLNLIMTGGPGGDLGSNQIQCYKGKICLVIDGGSVLFDPDGLDKKELMKLCFMRHSSPRENSLGFPVDKLGPKGFIVKRKSKNITLPDGTYVEDGAIFHRTFLTDPENRRFFKKANIQAFIPCGGVKDTINHSNVDDFLNNFKELKFIEEGANVFFDDAARRHIASYTDIKQIKDFTANKGGVFSSSTAEVLSAFLFQDDYDEKFLQHIDTRWALIKDIIMLVKQYSAHETDMLIKIHETDTSVPLFELSETTSEFIYSLQAIFEEKLGEILKNKKFIWKILEHYIPGTIVKKVGKKSIINTLNSKELNAYRNAIITKKLSSMAFYKFGLYWDKFLKELDKDFLATMDRIVE